MKLKLDENFGGRVEQLLRASGHDVATVFDERLVGAQDAALIAACQAEGRCLVTLDLDFANPLLFDPRLYSGIAVLRPPKRPSIDELLDVVRTLVRGLETSEVSGKLWSVQEGRIREYRPDR